uniref:InlB B-repeat-containing protein n=1 Tax=Candidatus Scatomorpha intestinigallinarum TaxID=2840923 RepID=UPI00402581A6
MKKSILALLLAVLMVASLLPAAALAVGPTENDVAAYTNKSGTTYYTTVGAAITAANKGGGGTIELLKNAELKASDVSYPYSYSDTYGKGTYVDKALILDLGGYTLTCNDYWGLDVTPYASLTVEHGTYEHKGGTSYGYTGTAIQANKVKEAGPGCTVTIESDATIKTDGDAVLCQGYNTVNVYGNIYCVSNGVFGMGPCNTVTLDGAYIESENYAVYQNPYSKTERKGSTYTIKDSTIIAGNDDPGVYLFNYTGIATSNHTLTIENSKISADIGVYLSCTDATIKGENTKIEYTNTAGNSVYFSHDGSATTPGGTVGSLTINGGEFVGPIGVEEPTGGAGNAAVISVNGGYFTEPVDVSYLSSEFKYMVHKDLYYSYYETLAEALQAAAPDGTVEAIAIPGRVIHTVTVVYGNGTADTVNTYVDGETINLPAAPTREGYAFLGWSDGDKTYNPRDEYTVTKDTTITALWKEEYNVVYIYNNGAATGHETVLKGESVTLPTPSKSGYAFLGWTCSDGNVYDGGDSVVIWGNTTFE